MNWQWTTASTALLFTGTLAAFTAVSLFRRRAIPGASALGAAVLAGAWWSFAAALEATAVPLAAKILFSKLEYVGSGSSVVFFLLFAFRYTGKTSWMTRPRVAALWALPAIAVSLAATNELHHRVWIGFSPGPVGSNSMLYHHGPAFFAILAGIYAYILVAASLLATAALRASFVQRRQSVTVLIATAFPVVGSILYSLGITPAPGLNLSPISFVLTGVVLAIGIVPLRLFELVPVAREALVERMSDGILVVDAAHRIVDFNPAAVELLGLRPGGVGIAAPHSLAIWPKIAPRIRPDCESHFELTVSQDPLVHLDLRVSPLRRRTGEAAGFLIVARDISARHRAERLLQSANDRLQDHVRKIEHLQQELRERAIRDALTGLFSRRYLDEELPRILEQSALDNAPVSVIMFDIDRFKQANDAHGHRAGDTLLVTLSRLLTRHSRPGDIVCRLGGDEFVLVLPRTLVAVAVERAEEIRRAFRESAIPDLGPTAQPTLSAGVALFPVHGRTRDELLHAADEALYQAKEAGRDCIRTANPRTG